LAAEIEFAFAFTVELVLATAMSDADNTRGTGWTGVDGTVEAGEVEFVAAVAPGLTIDRLSLRCNPNVS
jgi:hypothetical protein